MLNIRFIYARPACLKYAALLFALACVFYPTSAAAAPKAVTFAQSGHLLLPDNWTVQSTQTLSAAVAEAKEQLALAVDSKSLFYASKRDAQGEEIATIVVEEAQPAPVNNNFIPLLLPEEKEIMYTSVRMALTGAFNMTGADMEVTEISFKDFGRYHTLIASGKQTAGHKPINAHLVYYFLPERTVLLVAMVQVEVARELNSDFTLIMDSFDPDTNYQPVTPPDRADDEDLTAYLSRVYGESND